MRTPGRSSRRPPRTARPCATRTRSGAGGACGQPPDAPSTSMLLLPALNAMFDTAEERRRVTTHHPPLVIYGMLATFAMVGALLAGYGMAKGRELSLTHAIGFALVLASTVYVIVDLEYPRLGFIRVDAADHRARGPAAKHGLGIRDRDQDRDQGSGIRDQESGVRTAQELGVRSQHVQESLETTGSARPWPGAHRWPDAHRAARPGTGPPRVREREPRQRPDRQRARGPDGGGRQRPHRRPSARPRRPPALASSTSAGAG